MECVDVFLDIIAFTILEQGLDCVLALMGTLDLEDGFRLPRLFQILALSVALILGAVTGLLCSLVLRHCCCRGGVIPCQETLSILINMSYSLWM